MWGDCKWVWRLASGGSDFWEGAAGWSHGPRRLFRWEQSAEGRGAGREVRAHD